MGHVRQWHRMTIGRSREVRGPDGMEMAMVATIVAIVSIMAIGFGARLLLMAQTLDAVSLASPVETNEVIYRAMRGRWPPADNPYMAIGNTRGNYTRNLRVDGAGSITAQLTIGPLDELIGTAHTAAAASTRTIQGSLSFRPESLGVRGAQTIVFLCGDARPIAGPDETNPIDSATLGKRFLPPFCR